jgi:hypothetical protein
MTMNKTDKVVLGLYKAFGLGIVLGLAFIFMGPFWGTLFVLFLLVIVGAMGFNRIINQIAGRRL